MTWVQTLAAVVAGGVITTGGSVVLEGWRAHRERDVERRSRESARREVAAELWSVRIALRQLEHQEVDAEAFLHLLGRHERWGEHRALLASDDDYLIIDAAYAIAGAVEHNLTRLGAQGLAREANGAIHQVEIALEILDPEQRLQTRLRSAIAQRDAARGVRAITTSTASESGSEPPPIA